MGNKQDFVIEDGVLTRYTGPGGDVTIPEGVTKIGIYAFFDCTDLTGVTIPAGVMEIREGAFSGCTGLTSISIAKGMSNISRFNFSDTPWLKNLGEFAVVNGILLAYQGADRDVTIPAGVTEIAVGTFRGCTDLTSVTIPEGVNRIGDYAFSDCTGLTSVTILAGVTEIGQWAFDGCTGLTCVTIPAGVKKIGYSAFYDCKGLTSVTIPEGVTEIEECAFFGCKGLTSVTIPESVTEIGGLAFSGCKGLTGVTIPEGVKTIRGSVFKNSRPAIIAPHIPVSGFDAADKPGACAGFAKLYLDGAALDEEIKAGYLKYIKGQKKRLYPTAIKHEELLRLMLAEKLIARKDIDPLLEECDKQNNIAAKTAVLDYAGKSLKPVDPLKEFKLKDL